MENCLERVLLRRIFTYSKSKLPDRAIAMVDVFCFYPNTVAPGHMWLLSPRNVVSVTEGQILKSHLIFNYLKFRWKLSGVPEVLFWTTHATFLNLSYLETHLPRFSHFWSLIVVELVHLYNFLIKNNCVWLPFQCSDTCF